MDELRADDPRWIGEYRLLGRLGAGGMGRVYLARSHRGRTVAVKLVRPELAAQDEFRTRFRREVLAARRVGGTWTAPVLDADTETEVPWVATGYVAGPSLQQVVGNGYGPLPERSVRVLAQGLARALVDIHAAGLVHRDLKPSNVMITIDGPRVIDFGIARALETVADGGLTYTGAMIGSPAFMSPEQVRGDRVTPACDIFCLGSVLAYAATGLQPFGAASSGVHAQMFRIVQEPPNLEALPEGLRELVAACLTKEPEARPSPAKVLALLGSTEEELSPDGEPWLPGAIVAQLGRQVVRLLELEAAETGSLPVVPASAARTSAPGPASDTASGPASDTAPGPASHTASRPASGTALGTGGAAARNEGSDGGDGRDGSRRTGGTGGTGGSGGTDRNGGRVVDAVGAFERVTADEPAAAKAGGSRVPGWARTEPAAGASRAPKAAQVEAERGDSAPTFALPQAGFASLPDGHPATLPRQAPPRGQVARVGGAGSGDSSGTGAGDGAGAGARRRWWGTLGAVLATLAVIAGGATAYVALHDGGKAGAGATPGRPPRTSGAAPSSAPQTRPAGGGAPTGQTGGLPDGMIGTWAATFPDGKGNESTRRLEVRGDGSVDLQGDGKALDGQEFTCAWSMRVSSAGPPVVLSPSQLISGPTASCEPGPGSTLILLDQDHLRRVSDNGQQLTYQKV